MKMSFDLSIVLPNFEIKKTKIYLSDFLEISEELNAYISPIVEFKHHLNHAELIIDKISIKGKISDKIDIQEFILALLKFEKKLNKELNFKDGEWIGEFQLFEKGLKYKYRSPCFKQEKI